MHFVLHGRKEHLCFFFALPVVPGQRENLADPLVDARFACAYLTDACKQLVEIIRRPSAALEPLVVQRKSLDDILPKAGRGPLAEGRADS